MCFREASVELYNFTCDCGEEWIGFPSEEKCLACGEVAEAIPTDDDDYDDDYDDYD